MSTVEEVQLRQSAIVTLTNDLGRCSVTQLSQRFCVTPETIRRDLKSLEHQGLLTRVHGGAVSGFPMPHIEILAVDDDDDLPIHQSQRRKQAIAHAALPLIPGPTAAIFIDAGSTTESFASVLARNYVGQNWLVVTNSPNVARTLSGAGVPDVMILGGTLKGRTQAIVGEKAEASLRTLKADIAFMGTTGLSIETGLTTSDPREASIKATMIAQSRRVVALCDSGKLNRTSDVTFASIDDIDFLVTDRHASKQLQASFNTFNTQVVIP